MKKIIIIIIGLVLSTAGAAQAAIPDFSFESGDFGDWEWQGSENAVLSSDTFVYIYNPFVYPVIEVAKITGMPNGNYMARINSYLGETYDGSHKFNVWNNYISQTFQWKGEDVSFWYNYFTWDYYPFDAPGFAAYLDENEVLLWSAGDLDQTPEGDTKVAYTGWREFNLTSDEIEQLGYAPDDYMNLTLYAGNDEEDDRVQSWVYIDDDPGTIITGDITRYIRTVPEPATLSLLGLGLFGLFGLKKRKTVTRTSIRKEVKDDKKSKNENYLYYPCDSVSYWNTGALFTRLDYLDRYDSFYADRNHPE